MTRTPELAPFRVIEACRQGLLLLGLHGRAMARLCALPLAIVCLNAVLIGVSADNVTPLQNFTYGLPGIAATGWAVFACVRLWVLGETQPAAPTVLMARDDRARLAHTTIVTYLLWKAMMAGCEQIIALLIRPEELLQDANALAGNTNGQMIGMVLLGVTLWALRFRVAPVLAAVDFPLRDYARRATGAMLSWRLLGVVLVCVELPKLLLFAPVVNAQAPGLVLLLYGNAVTFVLELWLFASFTAALKAMMSGARA